MDVSIFKLTRDDLQSFIWDAYKEAYGIRPRFMDFESMSMDQLRKEADSCANAAEAEMKREEEQQEADLAEFKSLIQKTIELGAGDEETALRWLTQSEVFYHGQDVEHWVWNKGILFTDYGRELTKRLAQIVDYASYEEEAA
jgi:hypothetical protein